ncbi:TetR/AcrR family transcriptional regulator [Pseudonocardia nematodicida]|uniref:TetR/AcrR family transcriptional regulator n=1 Tax=Pseudonocardia nematodicida TaxID=1206997 RepID=A0ABV1KFQ6_9PSEU
MPAAGSTTKSDARRRAVVAAAVRCFAHKGFYGTTTNEIAEAVGISQPYLYRLYPNKEALFASAVDHVSVIMTETLTAHSTPSDGAADPEAAVRAARDAYTALVADRAILRFLMHANCAADETLVAEAVRRCYATQVDTVRRMLGDDDAVRRWFGSGMLDNVVAVLDLDGVDEPWARVLAAR